uniref:Uncharacterized protein n=1 Tax=Rhizophora mucronata TaxID=61149 RepID=A0A2P2NXT3_RHIMU
MKGDHIKLWISKWRSQTCHNNDPNLFASQFHNYLYHAS